MITDTFGKMLKSALVEDAELREAFIIDSVRPLVEERDGKIYLKADIALRVKSNQDAVEQYKEKVREVLDRMLKPTFDAPDHSMAAYNQTFKELGL